MRRLTGTRARTTRALCGQVVERVRKFDDGIEHGAELVISERMRELLGEGRTPRGYPADRRAGFARRSKQLRAPMGGIWCVCRQPPLHQSVRDALNALTRDPDLARDLSNGERLAKYGPQDLPPRRCQPDRACKALAEPQQLSVEPERRLRERAEHLLV